MRGLFHCISGEAYGSFALMMRNGSLRVSPRAYHRTAGDVSSRRSVAQVGALV